MSTLDELLGEINRVTEMMDNLLTLARADEGRATLAVKPHDLRELVSEAAETAGILGRLRESRFAPKCRTNRSCWRWTTAGCAS